MKLTSQSFEHLQTIPGEFAFAIQHPTERIALSTNKNPQLSWVDIPTNTQSFALICHDSDVPSSGEDVNQAGKKISATLPRVDFYHWVLIDIPSEIYAIAAGSHSSSITAKGKASSSCPIGKHGINDYTAWFAGDNDMGGDYYGYDGPCPPWNDEIKHHYHFTVYALDTAKLSLPERFTGQDALLEIKKHTLGQARITGIYTLNPAVQI